MIDVLSIASDGYLSKYKKTQAIATRGYLSVYAIVVIEVPVPAGVGVKAFGYIIPEGEVTMAEKEVQMHQEDSEIMLIVQIFIMRWVY